jgi:hypothetical protein
MDGLFKLLGVLVVCYVAYGFRSGEIYARSGAWGRTFRRDENAFGYWSAMASYGVLAVLLLFVF